MERRKDSSRVKKNKNIFHIFYHFKVSRPVSRKVTFVYWALSSLHGGSFEITLSFFTRSVPGIPQFLYRECTWDPLVSLQGVYPGSLSFFTRSVPGIHKESVYTGSLKGVYPGSLKEIYPGFLKRVYPGSLKRVYPGSLKGVYPGSQKRVYPE